MNVIVITLDTLRKDHLGCYGNKKVRTPSIDAFAKTATRFDRAYCTSFPTVPMRTDCFTGNTNFPRYGWKPLGDEEVLLTEVLAEAGYYTGFVTDTTNMLPTNFGRGFHEVHPIKEPDTNTMKPEEVSFGGIPPEHYRQEGKQYQRQMAAMSHFEHEADWFVARTMCKACEFVEENAKRDKFFLWVDTFEIHEVWYPPLHYVEQYSPNYDDLDYMFPNYGYLDIYEKPEYVERLRARYAGEVTLADRWVGHLLRQVEVQGLLRNTMIVLISDHGMYIGEHNRTGKHTVIYEDPWPLYEEVAAIPLLVWLPGSRKKKRRVPGLAQPADLMPTVLDACEVACPDVYGKSWLPLMAGKSNKNWKYIFSAVHNGQGDGKISIVSTRTTVTGKRWSYLAAERRPDGTTWPAELYDVVEDPGQKKNVVRRHQKIAAKMQAALVEFMKESGAEAEYVAMYENVEDAMRG